MKTLIRNIKTIVGAESNPKGRVCGQEMNRVQCIHNGWISIADDIISGVGEMKDIPSANQFDMVKDADDRLILPAWCDPHTHLIYAGSREGEFIDRIRGLSYEEIAHKGGGILNSAEKLNNISEDELFIGALNRLNEIARYGTGAVEIKSGYGLTVEGELKMLRVIKRLKKHSPLTIKATFLGAHAIPLKYKQNRSGYIDIIVNEMLPEIGREKLADYCDVFCDRGFFTPDETTTILQAASKYGLQPKIHANELDYSGGIQVGVSNNALSVDHLEYTGDKEIEALRNSTTMPTLLPSTAFFLNLPYPPARKMIDAGLPVALATDYNPGSSPSGKMQFVLSLACIKLKMLPEEAINAATLNAAYAMGLSATHGSITVGKKANLIITKPLDNYNLIPYSFGSEVIDWVLIGGKAHSDDK